MRMPFIRRLAMSIGCVAGVVAVALGVAGCSNGTPANPDVTAPSVRVVTSFYPLQFITERVGGGLIDVDNLTPPGAEPHDLELGASDLVSLREADLVVYLRSVATAVDDAVSTAAAQSLDVSDSARLEKFTDADHAVLDDGHEDDHGDADLGIDTHFWLDPLRLADVADVVAAKLGAIDPANAAAFDANAASLRADLVSLDSEFALGLQSCKSRDLVTSHAAFGYLAARYDLHQESVSGLSPDEEPTPAALARVADFVKSEGVTTIFTETLVSAAVARAIADETGVSTAVLDPLEGLAADATGDYLSVMRANLATLRRGLGCS